MTRIYIEETEGWYYAADVDDRHSGCYGLPPTTTVPDDVWQAYLAHRQAERVWHHVWRVLEQETSP